MFGRMTNREFLLECRRNETNAFHRVLNALPRDKWDYAPHEKSQSASRIVWTLIGESRALSHLIDHAELVFGTPPEMQPATLLREFEQSWDELNQKIAAMDDAHWDRPGKFIMNGQVRSERPTSAFVWSFFFDAIHHRGQLSTYIRPMGGRVPSIYGPSGDDPTMLSASHRRME